MIILKQAKGIPDRAIHDVRFKNGIAVLEDALKPKAEYICKFWNVKAKYNVDVEEVEELLNPKEPAGKTTVPPVEKTDGVLTDKTAAAALSTKTP